MRNSSVLPDWSRRSTLLAAGAFCYLALVGAMICAIVSLIPSQQWPAPSAQPPKPVAITIPVLTLVIDRCIQNTVSGRKDCNPESNLEAIQEKLRKRYEEYLRSSRNGTGNLLWAPPGTIFAAAESFPVSMPKRPEPAAQPMIDNRNRDRPAAIPALSTLALR
jgi:hypothetical protein